MTIFHSAAVVLVLIVCAAAIPLDEFFPFGLEVNDESLLPDDDGFEEVRLTTFPAFSNVHESFYVSVEY